MKNQWKTFSIEEKLDVLSQLEKSEKIVGIYHNVRPDYSSARTINDNADRIKGSAKSGTQAFV